MKDKLEIYTSWTFVFLWVLDIITTVIFVKLGGISLEYNPLMRYLISQYGLYSFFVIKLFILYIYAKFIYPNNYNKYVAPVLTIIMLPIILISILLISFLLKI